MTLQGAIHPGLFTFGVKYFHHSGTLQECKYTYGFKRTYLYLNTAKETEPAVFGHVQYCLLTTLCYSFSSVLASTNALIKQKNASQNYCPYNVVVFCRYCSRSCCFYNCCCFVAIADFIDAVIMCFCYCYSFFCHKMLSSGGQLVQ